MRDPAASDLADSASDSEAATFGRSRRMRTNSVLEKIVELFKTDFLGPPAVACLLIVWPSVLPDVRS